LSRAFCWIAIIIVLGAVLSFRGYGRHRDGLEF
jgi:hypothetical protein